MIVLVCVRSWRINEFREVCDAHPWIVHGLVSAIFENPFQEFPSIAIRKMRFASFKLMAFS